MFPTFHYQQDGMDDINQRKWFVAIVKRNTERACRERLAAKGYESFVASQTDMRQWRSGKRTTVERVIIPAVIFIHVTEQERLAVVQEPYIFRFMTDRAGSTDNFGRHPLAVISDHEMHTLRFMLYNTDRPVIFSDTPVRPGDRVRVIRGSLKGFEGEVMHSGSDTYLVACVGILGSAMVNIPAADLIKI